ncbi:MAG: response regulator [Cyclobacteriaceae bacterium]
MKKRTLIVDDSTYMRMNLKKKLQALGYDVIGEARTGEEALDLIELLSPDLITLDNILPDMSGLDILEVLKQKKIAINVLMISALGQKSIIRLANEYNIKGYLIKPFDDYQLEAALDFKF